MRCIPDSFSLPIKSLIKSINSIDNLHPYLVSMLHLKCDVHF